MRPASEQNWDATLTRYFAAHGLPLRWDGVHKRFKGIAGHVFARKNPKLEDRVWARMPEYVKRYGGTNDNVIVFVTNKEYGDSVDDTYVVMRMGTFIPMMKALLDSDRERWSNAPNR